MEGIVKFLKVLQVAAALSAVTVNISPAHALSSKQAQMLAELEMIKSVFYATYAPTRWKREFANWSLDDEIAEIADRVRAGQVPTVKAFQRELLGFFNSTRDYHVGVRFLAREEASLPFQVKGVGDRFFLVHIDREQLPASRFPFAVGDELVRFNGRPTLDSVRQLEAVESAGNPETQRALAELNLTHRRAARGLEVPRGRISLVFQRKSETTPKTVELEWAYTPESAAFNHDNTDPLDMALELPGEFAENDAREAAIRLLNRRMAGPRLADVNPRVDNPFAIGTKKSYVPELGEKIFEYDQGFFHVRIFRVEGGKTVGIVRIPSYEGEAAEAAEFVQIIRMMEQRTDALVLDQVGNPGGSVPFLYSLVSTLTTRPMTTPHHHIALTQADVVDAESMLPALAQIHDDASARALIGETIGGYPVSHALARRLEEYSNFIVNQWRAGKRYTEAFFLVGVDKIEPHPQVNYTKPILVLTDNLDFSGGDFFPAILQDNHRAKILGTRTAGAGGYVLEVKSTNLMGVESFSLTGSLAQRLNSQPIENLGVTPDILHRLTIADLQNQGADLKQAILSALR